MGLVLVSGAWVSVREAYALLDLLNHPGHPDQKSHGRKGGGGGAPVTDRAALEATPYGIGDGNETLDAALDGYAGSDYAEINAGLRDGNASAAMQPSIDTLDAGMESSRLTSAIQVGRGIRNPREVFGDAWNDSDVTGLQWTDGGFASSTANSARTRSGRSYFTGDEGVAMTVTVPRGTGALAIGRADRGQFGEMEILLDRGLSYRVVRDNGVVEGIRMLDVEVVP